MAVPDSGAISMGGIHFEKTANNYNAPSTPSGPVTMFDLIYGGNASGSSVSYAATNQNSSDYPNTTAPHGMDEWYSYDHDTAGAPSAPTNLAYTATSTSTITFTFTEDPNATKVYFYQGAGASFTLFENSAYKFNGQTYVDVDGSGTTSIVVNDGSDDQLYNPAAEGYTDISLGANDYMDVKYKSWNSTDYSGYTSDIRGWTLPGTPGSLSESGQATNAITINWAAPTGGASSYNIWFGTNSTMASNTQTTGNSGTSKAYSSLNANTRYYWWIAAVGGGSDVGAFSSAQSGWTLPDVPTNLHEDSLASTSVTLDWDAPTGGADSYSLLFGKSYYSHSNAVTESISSTGQSISGLDDDTTYYWAVRSTGDDDQDGVWTSVENFSTPETAINTVIYNYSQSTNAASSYVKNLGSVSLAAWSYSDLFRVDHASSVTGNTTFTPGSPNNSAGSTAYTNRETGVDGTTFIGESDYQAASNTRTYDPGGSYTTGGYFKMRCYIDGSMGTGVGTWYSYAVTVTNTSSGTDTMTLKWVFTWTGGGRSDLRIKQDITRIGTTPDGIPWYSFRFKDDPTTLWSGVIAQDLLKMGYGDNVVYKDKGIFHVMYHELNGVEMRPIINGVIQ